MKEIGWSIKREPLLSGLPVKKERFARPPLGGNAKVLPQGGPPIPPAELVVGPLGGELTEFLAAVADVISTISPDDENYDFFTTTISFSSQELYCEHMGEELTFSMPLSKQSRPCSYLDEDGETVYDFACFVEANVAYSINAPKLVAVAERDKALLTYKEEMQNYLNGLSEAEIVGSNIKKMLIDKSAELADSLSTENMKLSPCEIYMLDINDAGIENAR